MLQKNNKAYSSICNFLQSLLDLGGLKWKLKMFLEITETYLDNHMWQTLKTNYMWQAYPVTVSNTNSNEVKCYGWSEIPNDLYYCQHMKLEREQTNWNEKKRMRETEKRIHRRALAFSVSLFLKINGSFTHWTLFQTFSPLQNPWFLPLSEALHL